MLKQMIGGMATVVLALGPWQGVRAQSGARFDREVRSDFFAGFGGDSSRLERGLQACERTLAENPNHAEALVWHGSGLVFKAGQAFGQREVAAGQDLWTRGMSEMNRAVALEPRNVGVLIPRGAVLLQASRNMAPEMARPLIETGLADYERTLKIQREVFASLGDHPKGELLFGLAEGYSRLGDLEKARTYFDRLVADAPSSGQAPRARQWLSTGSLPAIEGLGCVGCHK